MSTRITKPGVLAPAGIQVRRYSSRAAVAVEALRRGVSTRAEVTASAAALRRRATSTGSVAAAALRRLAS